jgi:uncharacterized membrane protein
MRGVARLSQPNPLEETLDTVAAMRERANADVDSHHRWIERVIEIVGRPAAVYVILIVVASWISYNTLGVSLGAPQLDAPPFFWLQGCACLYAALIATAVLVKQNREAVHDAQRDHLELQVNLISEQRTAKIIALLEELRADMPNVRDRVDKEANAMSRAIDPEEVINALEDESPYRVSRRSRRSH